MEKGQKFPLHIENGLHFALIPSVGPESLIKLTFRLKMLLLPPIGPYLPLTLIFLVQNAPPRNGIMRWHMCGFR